MLAVRPAFGGANAGVEEQRFGCLSQGEQIIGAENIFNVLLNSGRRAVTMTSKKDKILKFISDIEVLQFDDDIIEVAQVYLKNYVMP